MFLTAFICILAVFLLIQSSKSERRRKKLLENRAKSFFESKKIEGVKILEVGIPFMQSGGFPLVNMKGSMVYKLKVLFKGKKYSGFVQLDRNDDVEFKWDTELLDAICDSGKMDNQTF